MLNRNASCVGQNTNEWDTPEFAEISQNRRLHRQWPATLSANKPGV